MVIPGYDPDDLEETLSELLDEHGDEVLTAEERRRIDDGESILDALETAKIEQLLDMREARSKSSPE